MDVRTEQTKLGIIDQYLFRKWFASRLAELANMGFMLNPDPTDSRHQYDYQGLYLDRPDWRPKQDGHWPSEFKLESHPNRYVDGVDTITGKRVKK